jgi:hypothetical protein
MSPSTADLIGLRVTMPTRVSMPNSALWAASILAARLVGVVGEQLLAGRRR